MQFNNILVVINPESDKQYALARAVRLVKEQKSKQPVKITLFLSIYNISYEMTALLSAEERDEMHVKIVAQHQEEIIPYIKKYADPLIEFDTKVIWKSNEAEAIVEQVEQHQYDLVVKYAKSENLSRLFFTPLDWQLLRKCPAPVLIVKDSDWRHQYRILVAVNVSGDEEYHDAFNNQLITLSLDLAHTLDRGNIHLVSAYPPSPINMAVDLPEFNLDQSNQSIRAQHLLNMKMLRQKFAIDEEHTHVYEGYPEDIIPEVAQKLEAELVVLGTIGRTGLSAAFLGNTAERVISQLNCNLLAIKP